VALQIVLSIDYTERGHLSSVLKEEVKEPEIIGGRESQDHRLYSLGSTGDT
jgi:hypothetical protein